MTKSLIQCGIYVDKKFGIKIFRRNKTSQPSLTRVVGEAQAGPGSIAGRFALSLKKSYPRFCFEKEK